jgi:Acyl-protein synthetase, LuxE
VFVWRLKLPCPHTKVRRYRAVKTHTALEKIVLQTQGRADQIAVDLDRRIQAYIGCSDPTDPKFDQIALELFAYQYAKNNPYRQLCDQRGRTPANVRSWREIPALSAASFGDARIACFPAERTPVTFVSSGTTRGDGTTQASSGRSVHELENTQLYDASLLAHFRRCVIPDLDKIRMIFLSPSYDEAPQSSLAYMLSKLYSTYGNGGGFFVRGDALDAEGVARTLRNTCEPVLIFGTAFAFVHFLDYCASTGLQFALPRCSRIVETGGFKGKSRSIKRDELYDALCSTFGVSYEFCIGEYGMCELGSQWYDAALGDALAGRTSRAQLKVGAHWTRTLVVDPVTAQELPLGSTGLLQVFDLSNRGSVAAVLTGDLVTQCDGGFIYVGRSAAAPPKGCSIAVDAMLGSRG